MTQQRQQWEYVDVFVVGDEWKDSLGTSGSFPAERTELTKWPAPIYLYAEVLNRYGGFEWELVSVDSFPSSTENLVQHFYFKRPKV